MAKTQSIKKIFKNAEINHSAIGQFNFSEISQLKGIIEAAKKAKQPFILGTSEGESKYLGLKIAVSLKKEAERELGFPVILNLDHGKSFEYLKRAIDVGYNMVHFDGSELSLKENIKITKKVVNYAHKRGVLVEGEIGYLRGSSEPHKKVAKIESEDMTKPEEAEIFIENTGVDALAIAIGNIHGIFAKMPNLDFERLSMVKSKVGKRVFLVLHGGSGISEKEIKEAIKRGIVKVNINTEIRISWRKGIEESLKKNPKEVTPYKLMPSVIKEVEKVVERKMKLFLINE
jgi:fructose-bisphosphate aldolase class II